MLLLSPGSSMVKIVLISGNVRGLCYMLHRKGKKTGDDEYTHMDVQGKDYQTRTHQP